MEKDFGSPSYWDALIAALLSTKSAYGLALGALRQRGGIVPLKHFPIACGAPIRQKKHLSPDTILDRLKKAHLVDEYTVPGVGPCVALLQGPDRYDEGKVQIRARLLVEEILLKAISDWLRRLGIASYDRVAIRDSGPSLPMVGTFAWDLSAPSYLSAFVQRTSEGKSKPGFVACDVLSGIQVNQDGLRSFINKCTTLRTLKRMSPCLYIFVADHFAPAAFTLAKQSGIVPATPANLFGQDVGEGLSKLFEILTDAAHMSVDPEKFTFVFEKLNHIEGAAVNLRGALFEYLAAEIVRRQSASPFVRIGKTYKLEDGTKINVDIISEIQNVSVTFIECKGYKPAGNVPDVYVDRWLDKISRLYEYARKHPEWKNLKIAFEFWSTGELSEAASKLIATRAASVRPSKYTVTLNDAEAMQFDAGSDEGLDFPGYARASNQQCRRCTLRARAKPLSRRGIRRKLQQLRLGRDGERAVGQYLERLREGGGQVFHDIPADRFNLDHVVISTHGIYAIETKTWTKPWPKATITVDGDKLLVAGRVPDRNPIEQASAAARWLEQLLAEPSTSSPSSNSSRQTPNAPGSSPSSTPMAGSPSASAISASAARSSAMYH
jgi:hypothetical protein